MAKVVSAEEAVGHIPDGAAVLIVPMPCEKVYPAFGKVFEQTGSPKDITIVWGAGLGPFSAAPQGMNHFAVPGMVRRLVMGHLGLNHRIMKMVATNEVEAYNLPQGTMAMLYRDMAAGRPGLLTKVGLGTFVDPRIEGGKMNDRTQTCEDLVELLELNGEEYLLYKSISTDVAILRGTTADPEGNISSEKVALLMEPLEGAMAVKNNGGIVIAQVERLSDVPANPHTVVVPGVFVDYIVVAEAPETHPQTLFTDFDPSFCGQRRADLKTEIKPMPLGTEKIICHRAAMELKAGMSVNLGIGIPMGVAQAASEAGILDSLHLNTELGVIGGLPQGGTNFGPSRNPSAILSQAQMFDWYDGGGLDATCVGMAQVDREGNVNVSRLGPKCIGCGGFINITRAAKKLMFCGEFCAVGLEAAVVDGALVIENEGRMPKFIEAVQQITFSGKVARQDKRDVLFITERCVFRLVPEGLMLIEIAPGIDLDRDILAHMAFSPIVPDEIPLMPAALFSEFEPCPELQASC